MYQVLWLAVPLELVIKSLYMHALTHAGTSNEYEIMILYGHCLYIEKSRVKDEIGHEKKKSLHWNSMRTKAVGS